MPTRGRPTAARPVDGGNGVTDLSVIGAPKRLFLISHAYFYFLDGEKRSKCGYFETIFVYCAKKFRHSARKHAYFALPTLKGIKK